MDGRDPMRANAFLARQLKRHENPHRDRQVLKVDSSKVKIVYTLGERHDSFDSYRSRQAKVFQSLAPSVDSTGSFLAAPGTEPRSRKTRMPTSYQMDNTRLSGSSFMTA